MSHGMRMGVILVLKTGLTLHYIAFLYITLHYIMCTFHIHFIDQPVHPMTLDVKPAMFYSLWWTSKHVIVTQQIDSLNNKIQNMIHPSCNLNVMYRMWCILQNTTTTLELHSDLKFIKSIKRLFDQKVSEWMYKFLSSSKSAIRLGNMLKIFILLQ